MENNVIELIIKAKDLATSEIEKIGATAQKQGASLADLGKKFAAAGAIITGVGIAGAKAMQGWLESASEAQVEMAKADTLLQSTAKSMGLSEEGFKKLKTATDDVAKSFINLGFDDETTANSFAKLVNATKDTTEANRLLAVSADLARFKGVDLEVATIAILKASQGSTRELKAMGMTIDDNATASQNLAKIQGLVAGQSKNYSETYKGAMDKMKVQTDNLKEALGERLIPAVTKLVAGISGFMDKVNNVNPKIIDLVVKVVAIGTAIALILGPILMIAGAVMMFGSVIGTVVSTVLLPAIAVIAGIVAVVGAVYLAFTNWDKITEFFANLWKSIKKFIDDTILWFGNLPAIIMAFITKLFVTDIPYAIGFLIGWITTAVPQIIADMVTWFTGLWTSAVQIFENLKLGVIEKLGLLWTWITTEVPTWPSKIVEWLANLPALIGGIFEDAKNKAVGFAEDLYNGVKGWFDSVIGWLKDIFSWGEKAAGAISNAFGKGKEAGAVQGQRADGGWINNTGLYLMHEGEYVMSNAMLRGNQRSEITTNNNNPTVNVYANVNNGTDVSKLAYALAYELRNK